MIRHLLIIAVLSLGASLGLSKPQVVINCQKGTSLLGIAEARVEGAMHPRFALMEKGHYVGAGTLELQDEGYENSFFRGYIWAFQSHDKRSTIGVRAPGLRHLKPGVYRAQAEVDVKSGRSELRGAALPCVVKIKASVR